MLFTRTKRDYPACFFFFFFQAEDGIRDKLVTGVQTCALPISNFLAGELADLDVDPTVELLALLARVVAQGTVLPDGNDLDRGLRSAEIDQELLDGLRAPLRQNLVVFGRALAIGVALDEHHPGARPVDDRGRVLKNPDGIGPEAGALQVEVDVGVDDTGVGRRRDGSPRGRRRLSGRGRDGARPGRGLLRGP